MREETFGHGTYLSPFTWRYGSPEMRRVFSENEKRGVWRKVWFAIAEAQTAEGLISESELAGIKSKSKTRFVDIGRANELERKIKHDLMAELRVFAEQSKSGGGKLHMGATSMDIEDNADALILERALNLILARMLDCLAGLRERILTSSGTMCMGWTHLQPAEPTTLGYRFANYAQDLVMDIKLVESVRESFLRGKGMKGAVGTSAAFVKLLGGKEKASRFERNAMKKLKLRYFPVSTQTYPRKMDYLVLVCLASIAQSCHRFGFDLRVLQSPTFGEVSEPIGEKQVGSSAMPFKRNPVTAERMCSLARYVSVLPQVVNLNASVNILERTIDDSASRRVVIPEAFLATEECLMAYNKIVSGMSVYPRMMRRNLERFGPFAGTEAVLMKLAQLGEDRQAMHEVLRVRSFEAWEEVMNGKKNPLLELLSSDRRVAARLSRAQLSGLMDPSGHVGDAEEKSKEFVRKELDPILQKSGPRRRQAVRPVF